MTAAQSAAPTPRATVALLELYAPDRTRAAIDLSDNTNRWGMPPAARDALRDAAADVECVTRYPEMYADSLKSAIAAYAGAAPDQVVTGCGSDNVLDAAIRALAEPGETIALPEPTFVMAARFGALNGLRTVSVPLNPDYTLPVDRLLACDPRIVYVCSPNNPTGTWTPPGVVEELARRANGFIIVDEAYAEFAGANALDHARRLENVLVVRTMSKAFGLAGLRVGYGIGAPALVRAVEKSRGPYTVGALCARAAVAAVRDGLGWVREHVEQVVANRERLETALRERECPAVPSRANFVFVAIAGAARIAARMRELGVGVRAFTGLPCVSPALRDSGGSALRISVGPWPMLETALQALDQARRECA
jgi:histidinol-phosphate aminotransferase